MAPPVSPKKSFLGRFYGEPAKLAAPMPPRAPRAVTPPPPAEGADSDSLKSRLAAIVRGRSVIAAGSFHLIGLAEIRECLGDGWEGVREKVHDQTRRIIARHIAPQDVYFPGGVDDYVLVFAALGKAAAELVCAMITQELEQTLLGDTETHDILVRTVVSETDGSLRLENANLSDLLASAAAELAGRKTPGSSAISGHDLAPLPIVADATILYRPVWDVQREVLSTYFSRRSLGVA